jgi:hypothetical protein
MSLFADQSVEVERTDNGYVLKWENKNQKRRHLDDEPVTRGVEVFTDREKLMARIKVLLF